MPAKRVSQGVSTITAATNMFQAASTAAGAARNTARRIRVTQDAQLASKIAGRRAVMQGRADMEEIVDNARTAGSGEGSQESVTYVDSEQPPVTHHRREDIPQFHLSRPQIDPFAKYGKRETEQKFEEESKILQQLSESKEKRGGMYTGEPKEEAESSGEHTVKMEKERQHFSDEGVQKENESSPRTGAKVKGRRGWYPTWVH